MTVQAEKPPKKRRRPRYEFVPQAKGTSSAQQADWRKRNTYPLDLDSEKPHILAYVKAIQTEPEWDAHAYNRISKRLTRNRRHPQLSKANLRRGYLALIEAGIAARDDRVLRRLTMKPTRTLSGIAPVTVLTKPAPCPGQCIFCPDDVKMPKSYLSNEPGAMRGLILSFDPFEQVSFRLNAMRNIGHTTDKVELLVLGGTWSSYDQAYQEWFIRRCFDAMNGLEVGTIEEAQRLNETAPYRNTGLVIETRPDHISVDEIYRLRWLGVTRVQLGVQSLDDHISALNKRGETSDDVRRAMRLLRGAGFKIAVHWMPNLLGATLVSDLADFRRFWDDPALRPDEMKIYPTGLLRGTELYEHYQQGRYRPYTEEELTDLLVDCKRMVPEYCRLNRVMRDIPAPEIADGVTTSNLRQVVQKRLIDSGTPCRCIRCREVRGRPVAPEKLTIRVMPYLTDHSRELFISAVTPQDKLAGFLRLSLPTAPAPIAEIDGQAVIRQVQVYGPSLAIDDESSGQAQHQGIGRRLIETARQHARDAGFRRLAVIAAAGTRQYYRKQGFELGSLYMSTLLDKKMNEV